MKGSLRIVLLTPSMSKGGAETQLFKLALFLKSRGHQVLLISLKPINEFSTALENSGFELLFLKNWSRHFLSNIRLLYRKLKAFKPEVLIAFMFVAIIFARLLKLRLKFRLISSIRISVLPAKWAMLFKITSGMDGAIVYNSMASKINFESRKSRLKPGIVIHNGISIPVAAAESRKPLAPGVFRWVCLGHFRWNKDYPTLFKAIALIRDKEFIIDILGELAGATWPARMIEELNIQSRVNLLGFQPEPAPYLKQSDAFVLSSFSEGMPNAVLEAMAHGLPVLVSDIDGNNELIHTARCGMLFEKQNEYDLAIKMMMMMGLSEAERKEFGAKGKTYITTEFSEAGVMEKWEALIEEVCELKNS